ncbi:MAG: DNA-3-methyladenine glycosylase I [Alphaproteobacteria bacterium]
MNKKRCTWCDDSQIYKNYHDNEWGKPLHDDDKLFEMLSLEGFQAGLSWITILKKREHFRQAFDNFNPQTVALYNENKVDELMDNEGIIRHRGKIAATIGNAKAFTQIQKEWENFDKFIWNYVDGKPILNQFKDISDVPAQSELSIQISKDLKKRGFKFVGPTIVYSFMQAIGMVNDHTSTCFLYKNP